MPKKNPRTPAGAPEHPRGQPTSQQPSLPTPPTILPPGVSGYNPRGAEPFYFDQALSGATWPVAAAADDVEDDNFMRAGVVNPNDVLPPPGLHFCNLSLREELPFTSRVTTSPTFPLGDLLIVDHAAREADDPLCFHEERFPEPSSHESAYNVGYARTDVYCPLYSDVTTSDALEYPSYSASGYQTEDAAVSYPASGYQTEDAVAQLSTYGSYSLTLNDEASELPGTSGSMVPYVNAAGGVATGKGFQISNIQSTSEESDVPTSSGAASKKGSYKHRHCRQYGLSKEEQMQRSKTLNNEATQLYRERKRKREKAIEDDYAKEEERKRDLLQQKRELQKNIEKFKKALGNGDYPDPPGDGSIHL